ncbi:nitroreductase family protein (plasmid) [Agrobacterium tumefaciens]|jgi:nitroreductase|uniref:nitroreductase family protein n=1 Tax=Agrobacterium tumefaciens TaxID=358 RepID=UPI001B8A73A9|nr:nitroreductase family protein [Agrobacterium tumefaciens]WCA72630.1 nitroreductase family protein [Agrobacterium tumefaciens]
MAATKLMLVAEGMELASCPMIGFDSASVASAFSLSATEAPVMLVTVGRAMEDNWPRKPHKPVSQVTDFGLTHLVIRHLLSIADV